MVYPAILRHEEEQQETAKAGLLLYQKIYPHGIQCNNHTSEQGTGCHACWKFYKINAIK